MAKSITKMLDFKTSSETSDGPLDCSHFSVLRASVDINAEDVEIESMSLSPDIPSLDDAKFDVSSAQVRVDAKYDGNPRGAGVVLMIDGHDGELQVADVERDESGVERWTLGGFSDDLRFTFR